MSKEDNQKESIMQFQQIQQQMQMLLMQKQNLQIQLAEIENALGEVEKNENDKIYEIVGNIMVKRTKEGLLKSLKEKKEIFDLRSSTIEKQTKNLSEKATELQKELSKQIEK